MRPHEIEQVEINSNDAFIVQFALRTARADIIDYTVTGCDLTGPAMTQLLQKRTWGRVTYVDCQIDDVAVRHIEGTGGTVLHSTD